MKWGEARDATVHPTMGRPPPTTKNYPSPMFIVPGLRAHALTGGLGLCSNSCYSLKLQKRKLD